MKRVFLTLAIAVIGLTASYAQTTAKPGTASQKMTAEQKAQKATAKLEQELTLSADQKQKIYAVELDKYKKSEDWHKLTKANRKAQKDQHIALKKETDAKLNEVLTADQKKKLQDIHAAKKAAKQAGKNNQNGPKAPEKTQ